MEFIDLTELIPTQQRGSDEGISSMIDNEHNELNAVEMESVIENNNDPQCKLDFVN